MNKQKIRFLQNTWLDIIKNIFSCYIRICFDLDIIFLGNFGTCQIFNYRIDDDYQLWWHYFLTQSIHFIVVVFYSDLFLELFFFSICLVYTIWFISFCGGRILNNKRWKVMNRFKLLLVSKSESVVFYFQAGNVELRFSFQEIQLLFPEPW